MLDLTCVSTNTKNYFVAKLYDVGRYLAHAVGSKLGRRKSVKFIGNIVYIKISQNISTPLI